MAHTHDKLCYTVEVFIVHDNKVLLRMHDKYNIWCSVGGHIESGEDPAQAAVREVKEESGLSIKFIQNGKGDLEEEYTDLPVPQFLLRHALDDGHEHAVLVYVATTEDITLKPHESEQITEFRWVSYEDLQQMELKANVKYYAEQALVLTRH